MASSFTRFRGHGFWSNDGQIEAWLALLVKEIDATPGLPAWAVRLKEEWTLQATLHGGGMVCPDLDEFASSEDGRSTILRVATAALQRLRAGSDKVTIVLDNYDGVPDEVWADHDKEWIECVAEEFIALLEGRVTTTASTSGKVIPRRLR